MQRMKMRLPAAASVAGDPAETLAGTAAMAAKAAAANAGWMICLVMSNCLPFGMRHCRSGQDIRTPSLLGRLPIGSAGARFFQSSPSLVLNANSTRSAAPIIRLADRPFSDAP
jgi:hypothetical protein